MKAKLVKDSLNEAYAEKDIKRIEDIFKKGKGNDEKVLSLTRTMAKLIKDPTKALARAEAAEQILGSDHNQIADIFYEREAELRGDSPAEPRAPKSASAPKANVSVPAQNPEVKSSEFGKPTYSGYRRASGNVGVIFLPTTSAIAIWEWEITGQMSDGAWENSKPDDHWVYWSNLETRLGQPQVQSTGHPLKTGYNLAGLIEYVGDRMVNYGRFGKAIGKDVLNIGGEVRSIVEEFPKEGPFDLETWKSEMIKENDWRKADYYWKGLEQKHVDSYYTTKYEMRDMRKDLSIIKSAMKNIKGII